MKQVVEKLVRDIAVGDVRAFERSLYNESGDSRVERFDDEQAAGISKLLREENIEKHGEIESIETKVIEQTDTHAQVLVVVTFADGHRINLREFSAHEPPLNLISPIWSLAKQAGEWRVQGAGPDDFSLPTATRFIESLLAADGAHNQFVSTEHSSVASREIFSKVADSIRGLKASIVTRNQLIADKPIRGEEPPLPFDYRVSPLAIEPDGERMKINVRLEPSYRSLDLGVIDSVIVGLVRQGDQWKVSLDDTLGLAELRDAMQRETRVQLAQVEERKQQPPPTTVRNETPDTPPRSPQTPEERRAYINRVSEQEAKKIMEAIGGGQDLVWDVVKVDYDELLDQYKIDIVVSFNGLAERYENYRVSGRITVNASDVIPQPKFARTNASDNYLEWESTINTAKFIDLFLE